MCVCVSVSECVCLLGGGSKFDTREKHIGMNQCPSHEGRDLAYRYSAHFDVCVIFAGLSSTYPQAGYLYILSGFLFEISTLGRAFAIRPYLQRKKEFLVAMI